MHIAAMPPIRLHGQPTITMFSLGSANIVLVQAERERVLALFLY